ncbi:Tripartite tricarboxylate transporter family receptor [compost metagenome]
MAPKGTPAPVVERLQAALTETLKDEAVKKRLLDMGIDPRSGTAAELDKQIKTEQPIVSQLIKQANIVLQ